MAFEHWVLGPLNIEPETQYILCSLPVTKRKGEMSSLLLFGDSMEHRSMLIHLQSPWLIKVEEGKQFGETLLNFPPDMITGDDIRNDYRRPVMTSEHEILKVQNNISNRVWNKVQRTSFTIIWQLRTFRCSIVTHKFNVYFKPLLLQSSPQKSTKNIEIDKFVWYNVIQVGLGEYVGGFFSFLSHYDE